MGVYVIRMRIAEDKGIFKGGVFSYRSDDLFILGNDLVILISNFSGKHKEFSPLPVELNFSHQFVAGYDIFFIPYDLLNNIRVIFQIFDRSRNKGCGDKADKFILGVSGIGGGPGEMAFKVLVVITYFRVHLQSLSFFKTEGVVESDLTSRTLDRENIISPEKCVKCIFRECRRLHYIATTCL